MAADTRRRAPARSGIGLALAALLLVLISLTALAPLLQGAGWWWSSAFFASLMLLVPVGLRALRLRRAWIPVVDALLLVAALTLFFGGGSGFLGVIPTPETIGVFSALVDSGAASIQQQSAPAIATPGLLFLLAVGAGIIGFVTDVVVQTLRMPALAALPVLVPIVVPGLIVEGGTEFGILVLSGIAYLVLLRVDVRARRSAMDDGVAAPGPRGARRSTVGATLGLAGVGLLAASVLAAATPSISTTYLFGTGPRGALFGAGVNPFINLGQDLRRDLPVDAFHYSSDENIRPYFSLMTLDNFDGLNWRAASRELDAENTPDAIPAPPGLSDGVDRSTQEITVVIDDLSTSWLPVPYPATGIAGLDGEWFWEETTRSIASADSTTIGERYVVDVLQLDPTPEQLRAASVSLPEEMAPYLALPDGSPPVLAETALAVTSTAGSPYDAAVMLQRYLRGADFTYSTEAPVDEGYDGAGIEIVARFLEEKTGYCVHFASTMAVLAREIGIPARVSIGFTSGTSAGTAFAGRTRFDVDTHDLHAWPELYFEGIGWLPFEPTPSRGSVPDYSRPASVDTSGEAAPAAPSESNVNPDTGLPELSDPEPVAPSTTAASETTYEWLGLAALVVFILLVPAFIRVVVRASRLRRTRSPDDPAEAAWTEIGASATDLGFGPLDVESPRAFATRLETQPGFRDDDARRALRSALVRVERERYGRAIPPGEAQDAVDDARDVIRSLGAGQSLLVRVRSVVLPMSLARSLLAFAAGSGPRRA
ncbi:DUF3488 and transglutaminase-like domain-containing protein [Agromyces atrinae]|uniref:DUF3488 and transglutaminase-like domain-containing protein n=1 Tax=Agromyces atrinae TaxID=592376 RepID=UPI001F5AC07D|nr:DUF3488 and transglutaminase-like domain-containing protein [Agromyces atrinae]MCI2959053.1 DUF3488 and transglutaminase-like domain-containing protein [Agromyces atrinae]